MSFTYKVNFFTSNIDKLSLLAIGANSINALDHILLFIPFIQVAASVKIYENEKYVIPV